MHSGDITLFSQKLSEDLGQFREALRDSAPADHTIPEAAV
jgi:hypothetical protein